MIAEKQKKYRVGGNVFHEYDTSILLPIIREKEELYGFQKFPLKHEPWEKYIINELIPLYKARIAELEAELHRIEQNET